MRMKNRKTKEVIDGKIMYSLLARTQYTHRVEGREYEDKLTPRASLKFTKQEDGTWLREELGSFHHTVTVLSVMYLITLLGNLQ